MTIDADGQRKLLEEGATSYVPAVTAVLAFRELVQSRCEGVLKKRLKEYSQALGVPLDEESLIRHKSSETEWDGTWANLGIVIRPGDVRSEIFHVLSWELADDGTWRTDIGVTIWLPRRKQVDQIWDKSVPKPAGLERGAPNEIWLFEPVLRDNIATFELHLDAVLTKWIDFWRQAGGLASVEPN